MITCTILICYCHTQYWYAIVTHIFLVSQLIQLHQLLGHQNVSISTHVVTGLETAVTIVQTFCLVTLSEYNYHICLHYTVTLCSDVRCGQLQCQSSAPFQTNTGSDVKISSQIANVQGKAVTCRWITTYLIKNFSYYFC